MIKKLTAIALAAAAMGSANAGNVLVVLSDEATLDLKAGKASLGCLLPAAPPALVLDRFGRVRMILSDGAIDCSLGVTDVRVYESDFKTPKRDVLAGISERIGRGVPTIIGVGVGRPFQREGDTEARHWLQVNNIHLEDDPAWKAV